MIDHETLLGISGSEYTIISFAICELTIRKSKYLHKRILKIKIVETKNWVRIDAINIPPTPMRNAAINTTFNAT